MSHRFTQTNALTLAERCPLGGVCNLIPCGSHCSNEKSSTAARADQGHPAGSTKQLYTSAFCCSWDITSALTTSSLYIWCLHFIYFFQLRSQCSLHIKTIGSFILKSSHVHREGSSQLVKVNAWNIAASKKQQCIPRGEKTFAKHNPKYFIGVEKQHKMKSLEQQAV